MLGAKSHQAMIEWKKASKNVFLPLPGDLLLSLQGAISDYFVGFDILTVPAPSFHTYDHYPIWDVALNVAGIFGLNLVNLFPNNSGKSKMFTFGSLGKEVQDIECPPNKFILILDDIYTTGATMRVSCEAIARKHSFPVGLAIA